MQVQTFPSGPIGTNAYLITCTATKEAAIVDAAPRSSELLLDALKKQNLTCKAILLTHTHWDHIADVAPLKEATGAPIYVHSLDAPNLIDPGADSIPTFFRLQGIQPDHLIDENSIIKIGRLNFKVIHTPGHTPGGVCFYEPAAKVLFSGDTLFKGTIGNTSFSTGQPDLMWPSLDKLAALPKDVKVYPGHGSSTTIENESGWMSRAKEIFS